MQFYIQKKDNQKYIYVFGVVPASLQISYTVGQDQGTLTNGISYDFDGNYHREGLNNTTQTTTKFCTYQDNCVCIVIKSEIHLKVCYWERHLSWVDFDCHILLSQFSTVYNAQGPLTTESPEAPSWHSNGLSLWWR